MGDYWQRIKLEVEKFHFKLLDLILFWIFVEQRALIKPKTRSNNMQMLSSSQSKFVFKVNFTDDFTACACGSNPS